MCLLGDPPDHLGGLLTAGGAQHLHLIVVLLGTVVGQRRMQQGQVGGYTPPKWIAGEIHHPSRTLVDHFTICKEG